MSLKLIYKYFFNKSYFEKAIDKNKTKQNFNFFCENLCNVAFLFNKISNF